MDEARRKRREARLARLQEKKNGQNGSSHSYTRSRGASAAPHNFASFNANMENNPQRDHTNNRSNNPRYNAQQRVMQFQEEVHDSNMDSLENTLSQLAGTRMPLSILCAIVSRSVCCVCKCMCKCCRATPMCTHMHK